MTPRFLRDNARWLCAGGVLTFLSSYGQTFFISIYSEEIRQSFSLSHTAWGSLYALATGASAVAMIWAGKLTDVFRVRNLGTLSLVALALACLSMALATQSWMLIIVVFLLRLSGQGMMSHIPAVAMTRWFSANRGKALSVAALGFAAGQAFLPLLFVALTAVISWRVHWIICAASCILMIPLLRGLLRQERTPQAIARENPSLGMQGQHWDRKDALSHPLFWLLVPTLLGPPMFLTTFFFQQVPLTVEKGWTHTELVALFPLYTVVSVVAMIGSGALVDRLGSWILMPFVQIPLIFAFLMFGAFDTIPLATLSMVLMGITAGATATVPPAFWAESYGTQYIGSIKSMGAAIMVLGSALGPGLSGALLDYGISLSTQMWGFAVYFLGACSLAGFAIARFRTTLSAAS